MLEISTIVPTRTPSRVRGALWASRAAMGAVMAPPMTRPRTASQGMPESPAPTRNPIDAATATMNSAVLTVPTTRCGACLVTVMSEGVATGPQPPPPVASTNPPIRPMGHRCRVRAFMAGNRFLPNPNRRMMTMPIRNRIRAIHRRAPSMAMFVRTTAPRNAPMAPGMAMTARTRLSTLPACQWLIPDTNVVPTLAACVPADAATAE